jgi:hypothetical protein
MGNMNIVKSNVDDINVGGATVWIFLLEARPQQMNSELRQERRSV